MRWRRRPASRLRRTAARPPDLRDAGTCLQDAAIRKRTSPVTHLPSPSRDRYPAALMLPAGGAHCFRSVPAAVRVEAKGAHHARASRRVGFYPTARLTRAGCFRYQARSCRTSRTHGPPSGPGDAIPLVVAPTMHARAAQPSFLCCINTQIARIHDTRGPLAPSGARHTRPGAPPPRGGAASMAGPSRPPPPPPATNSRLTPPRRPD